MEQSNKIGIGQKIKVYMLFTKFRLAFSVLLSAIAGYLFAGGKDWEIIFLVFFGGLLVTAASNGSNQIWEKDLDKLMNRTKKRPLPTGEMSVREAYVVVAVSLIVGLYLLYCINSLSAILGFASYVSYVFMYTPMKRKSPWAVLVGAFPGALPPMIGAIAHTGEFGLIPGALFFVQFMWQFPHFWAIAWVAFDDYKAGGFSLLPSSKGKSKNSAFQIMLYSLFLIPFSLVPWMMGWTGTWSLILIALLGTAFFLMAYRLFMTCDDKDAKRLMFASIIYLPIVQFIYVFDKVNDLI